MMHLAPQVFIATIRGRAVVLDLLQDKYLALGPDLARAALALLGETPTSADDPVDLDAARAALVAKGILSDAPEHGPTRPILVQPEPPATTLWPSKTRDEAAVARLTPAAFMAIMWALADTWIALRTLPFHRTIARVTRQKPRPPRASAISEQGALDQFFAARPWFPAKPICRLDALALCRFLRRAGHPADLVFGVKLEMFAAHCWVQCGERVLNEPHEIARRYAPIMVV
ncbi:lasso peptide biosynthesis B2 protein [Phenylobacterium sp.]|uniref:lasso peptide biosynthesis B2 protein n=1 Tax=Phenylobacterium sp. TaxID=1871053 RepID=UPI002FCBD8B6